MNDEEEKLFVMDMVAAINEVAETHEAGTVDKLAIVAALGDAANKGEWYSVAGEGE